MSHVKKGSCHVTYNCHLGRRNQYSKKIPILIICSSTSAFGSLPIKRERYLFVVMAGSETWHLASQDYDELHDVLCGTCQSLDVTMVLRSRRLENGYIRCSFYFFKAKGGVLEEDYIS
jgi:hypothetical protein